MFHDDDDPKQRRAELNKLLQDYST